MKKAILLGSNGPNDLSPLRYALDDVRELSRCFRGPRCGFETVEAPPGLKAYEIRNFIEATTQECGPEDTVVCYFSGHGAVDQGSLFLLWDDTRPDRFLASAIPADDVFRALRFCKAENKLLILDCCRAGAIVNRLGFKDVGDVNVEEAIGRPENFLILMASDRLESTREFDVYRGSFLAHHIIEALGDRFNEAVSDPLAREQRLSVHRLEWWLEHSARRHNAQNSALPVPIPYLFGKSKGHFFITVGSEDWVRHSLDWPDGSRMIVLPLRDGDNSAFCVSQSLITNKQYRDIVGIEPSGKTFVQSESPGEWVGPFYPWRDPRFSDDQMPVVCVSFNEAANYAHLVGKLGKRWTFLPREEVWDFAAFGTIYPQRHTRTWLSVSKNIHHRANAPLRTDDPLDRSNHLGIDDLVGNVWEWCMPQEKSSLAFVASFVSPVLRGGGFLDDLTRASIFVDSRDLLDGDETRHTDLGFRIAGVVSLDELPEVIRVRLSACPSIDEFERPLERVKVSSDFEIRFDH
jgi:hypothetical protein